MSIVTVRLTSTSSEHGEMNVREAGHVQVSAQFTLRGASGGSENLVRRKVIADESSQVAGNVGSEAVLYRNTLASRCHRRCVQAREISAECQYSANHIRHAGSVTITDWLVDRMIVPQLPLRIRHTGCVRIARQKLQTRPAGSVTITNRLVKSIVVTEHWQHIRQAGNVNLARQMIVP